MTETIDVKFVASDSKEIKARALFVADLAVRTYLPFAVETLCSTAIADTIRKLPPINSEKSGEHAGDIVEKICMAISNDDDSGLIPFCEASWAARYAAHAQDCEGDDMLRNAALAVLNAAMVAVQGCDFAAATKLLMFFPVDMETVRQQIAMAQPHA